MSDTRRPPAESSAADFEGAARESRDKNMSDKRSWSWIGTALVAAVVGLFFARPEVVRALAGLNGRTHLIVREGGLTTLYEEMFQLGGGAAALTLKQRDRNGVVAADPYFVPAGRVFVVTDVTIQVLGGTNVQVAKLDVEMGPLSAVNRLLLTEWLPRDTGWNANPSASFHLTGGLAYDAGNLVQVRIPADTYGPGLTYRCWVVGYETEAQ